MPTYDYLCKECGYKYDIFFKSKENIDEILCPKCNSRNSVKLFSAPMLNIGTVASGGTCETCTDNNPSYGGCSSGLCGLD